MQNLCAGRLLRRGLRLFSGRPEGHHHTPHHHAHTPQAPHTEAPVLFAKHGTAMEVTLNRPKALNALTLAMVRLLQAELPKWNADKTVASVILKGAGGKAFCAGGDVRTLAEGRGSEEGLAKQESFFREEYRLDYGLAKSAESIKPHVAIYDGTVMGGGVGISFNATFRIATENSLYAMPETAIGFFPDVGGSYFLPRMKNHFGTFLALTGHRLKGADVVHSGMATHFVPAGKIAEMEAEIRGVKPAEFARARSDVETIVKKYAEHRPSSYTDADLATLGAAFSHRTVEDIMTALKKSADQGSHVAEKALTALHKMSPTSMKVTLEQMLRGAKLNMEDCFKMELCMAMHFVKGVDFYEGVRAVLVDKDNKPKWQPAELHAVKPQHVQAYFAPLPAGKELQLQ